MKSAISNNQSCADEGDYRENTDGPAHLYKRCLSIFFQAEDGIRYLTVTGVQTCALPIYNEHNSWIPRDFWLEDWEKRAILDFHARYPLEGYRRLTFMMLDADVVAVSPTSVWRVLHWAGRLSRWKDRPSGKGKGFEQPLGPHQHWHGAVA